MIPSMIILKENKKELLINVISEIIKMEACKIFHIKGKYSLIQKTKKGNV